MLCSLAFFSRELAVALLHLHATLCMGNVAYCSLRAAVEARWMAYACHRSFPPQGALRHGDRRW